MYIYILYMKFVIGPVGRVDWRMIQILLTFFSGINFLPSVLKSEIDLTEGILVDRLSLIIVHQWNSKVL